MNEANKIKEVGLKVTPQRKKIYGAMMQLHHATVEDIVAVLHEQGEDMTVSTVYRVLDSFCSAGLLTLVPHPETGRCYYDVTVKEHSHVFSDLQIMDYDDSGLLGMVRKYLEDKADVPGEIDRIQIQITVNKSVTPKR